MQGKKEGNKHKQKGSEMHNPKNYGIISEKVPYCRIIYRC
jgi:hypothetical protein